MRSASPAAALRHMAILLAISMASGFAQGTPATASKQDEVVGPIKMRDIGLDQVLELLELWTQKTYLRPQNLPAVQLNLNLKQEVTRSEAVRAIETVLSLNGIALTPLGDAFVKVTPLNAVKSEAPELIPGTALNLPASSKVAAKLFQLKFLRVGEFMPQIAGLLSSATGAPPIIFEKSNAALITDTISNLQRVEILMVQVDRPLTDGLEPKFYQLSYAKASDVVSKLKTMLSGPLQNQIGTATSYNPDDRTNQIILFADKSQYGLFDQLIAKLDIRSGQDTRTEILYLKHAAAKDVATLLSQLVSSQLNAARNGGQDVPRATGSAPVSPANPGAAPVAPTLDGAHAANEASHQFSSVLTILPEDRSNALVVSGTDDDLKAIDELVARIDVLLSQVRIEVVIAEVNLSNNSSTGIGELGLSVVGDKVIGLSATLLGLSAQDVTVTRPSAESVVTGQWDLAGEIKLAATPRKSNARILSVPTIITTHNREGKIFVGEQRPVISSYLNDSGSTSGSGGTASGYRSTISSKDIGIQLSVKPLIGADGSVQLEIRQEVNDVLGEVTIDGNPQPRIGRRSTESFVSARSGEIIVLGGLQRTSQSGSTSRLGPVPIVGDLLGTRTKEKTRTDLLFFLRPTVLANTSADSSAALDRLRQGQRPDELKAVLGTDLGPAVPK